MKINLLIALIGCFMRTLGGLAESGEYCCHEGIPLGECCCNSRYCCSDHQGNEQKDDGILCKSLSLFVAQEILHLTLSSSGDLKVMVQEVDFSPSWTAANP